MANSRNKGAAFEREVVNLIKDCLGFDCKRNLDQTRDGGHDLLGVPGWAVECKRYAQVKHGDLTRFWEQTVDQAIKAGARPCLIVKEDRQPIMVFVDWDGPGKDAYDSFDFNSAAQISFDLWCSIVRETLDPCWN
jgi:Holliday junction resolvase